MSQGNQEQGEVRVDVDVGKYGMGAEWDGSPLCTFALGPASQAP